MSDVMAGRDKRAVVIGCAGMDGSHCCDLLLSKGYMVRGINPPWGGTANVAHLLADPALSERFKIATGDVTDASSLRRVIGSFEPDEVFNMADQDGIGHSFECPDASWEVTAGGPRKLLEVVRTTCPRARVFQALSITMFGTAPPPQNEGAGINPLSPYACAKAAAWHLCTFSRQHHGLYVSCGIFCNHTSPRQGPDYLLPKIVREVLRIARDRQRIEREPWGGVLNKLPEPLILRSLGQMVDIGWAPDYVDTAWRSLQQDTPDDYVVATGQAHSIRTIVEEAMHQVGLRMPLEDVVKVEAAYDPNQRIPATYIGDNSRAHERLGWEPQATMPLVVSNLIHSYKNLRAKP